MLIELKIENFRSISEQQTLSFVAGRSSANLLNVSIKTGNTLAPSALRSACLFGANGSGKTSIIEAISFLKNFVEDSAKDRQVNSEIETQAFVYDPEWRNSPTELEVVFIHNSVLYQYGFVVDRNHVHQEWLYEKPNAEDSRLRKIFTRSLDVESNDYDWYLNKNHLHGERESWRKNTRANALFLSTAVQLNSHELRIPYEWLVEKLRVVEDASRLDSGFSAMQIHEGNWENEILAFLKAADVPLEGIEIDIGDFDEADLLDKLPKEILDDIKDRFKDKKVIKEIYTTRIDSSGEPVKLSFGNESSGTKLLFSLSGPLLDTLEHGYTIVIDELHNNLHPLALKYLIDIFASHKINTSGAQLLFTSHDSSILDNSCLHKDQIWFVEKSKSLSTSIVPLSSFKDRSIASLQKAYLNGRFGAIPLINDIRLD